MRKKINSYFIFLAVIAILVTITLSTIVDYALLKKEVMDDLASYAQAMKDIGVLDDLDALKNTGQTERLRITLVARDGRVLFDNSADITKMDNHEKREEIEQARKRGYGQAIRRSNTMEKNTYYYTILLDDGSVLRVSKEARSISSVFLSAMPITALIVVVLILLSVLLAYILTKSIVDPIEKMAQNIDKENAVCAYKELRPFQNMITENHRNIVKVADMRQEFTANISHELKTPLTSISGYAELIENGMATEADTTRFAHEIHHNANRLLTLINDIIRLSELDVATDEMILYENLDLYRAAEKCVEMLQVNATKRHVSLQLQGIACQVTANREMLDELVYNLCDNAIRYNNPDGRVDVRVYPGLAGGAVLEVKDTGIGIPKEHQERIFERFYRVDKSRSKETGGTGLGLAIVKHIVVQNHAKLELESEQGKGTCIKVLFPAVWSEAGTETE